MRRTLLLGVLTAGCLHVPMEPDRPDFSVFTEPAPHPAVAMEVTPLLMSRASHAACGLVWDDSCFAKIDMVHAAYLVKHPRGTFLIDTGLSDRGKADLARFSWTTRQAFAFDLDKGLGTILKDKGTIDFVILTHPHWDHTSGLVDLPHPRVMLSGEDAAFLKYFRKDEPVVMPEHFANATLDVFGWDGPAYENFPRSHDVFGDGSVVLVPLPGHTPGAVGVFLDGVHGRRLFFIGDTVWARDGLRLPSQRPSFLADIADDDVKGVSAAIHRIRHLQERHPDLLVVPAHDGAAFDEVTRLSTAP